MAIFNNNRDKAMAAVVFLAIALTYGFYDQIWSPKQEELNATQARADSLFEMNKRAKAELSQGKTAELRAEAARYAQDLEVMRRLVPTSNEVPALLEQVSTAARRVGLDIADVQPEALLVGDQYDAYKYRLSMRGNFHQIGTLLANIGSLQRIVAPINLTLAPAGPVDPKKGRVQPVLALFEIQTYVARNPPPAPKPLRGSSEKTGGAQ
jgi:type IV pilus assembly protein PilO